MANKTMFELWQEVKTSPFLGKDFAFADWCEFRSFAEATGLDPDCGVDRVREVVGATKSPVEALDALTVAELKKLAAEKEIDLGEAKRKAEIIQIILGEAKNECD